MKESVVNIIDSCAIQQRDKASNGLIEECLAMNESNFKIRTVGLLLLMADRDLLGDADWNNHSIASVCQSTTRSFSFNRVSFGVGQLRQAISNSSELICLE